MKYKVVLKEKSHYVLGLESGFDKWKDKDALLIYHYEAGDIDTRMKDAKMMLGALYDLFQVQDNLHEGDVFETEFGDFVCQGVHVVPVRDESPTLIDFTSDKVPAFSEED